MKSVDPIREKQKIQEVKEFFEKSGNIRNLLMFVAGINFALRITDLLQLKIGDLFQDGQIRDFFEITEKKTKKVNRVFVTDNVKKVLKQYVMKYPGIALNTESYVFFSDSLGKKAIGRRQALNVVHAGAEAVGLQGRFGTHSLRKSWGYQARKNDVPLEIIQNKLNHASLRVTERYLGITTDEIGKACLDLNL